MHINFMQEEQLMKMEEELSMTIGKQTIKINKLVCCNICIPVPAYHFFMFLGQK